MEMIRMFAPAETTSYMLLGFSVIFGTILIYIRSLYSRHKRNKVDFQMFEEINKDK